MFSFCHCGISRQINVSLWLVGLFLCGLTGQNTIEVTAYSASLFEQRDCGGFAAVADDVSRYVDGRRPKYVLFQDEDVIFSPVSREAMNKSAITRITAT